MTKKSNITKKFGMRVKELRLKKGITSQMALAHKAGLDRTYVSSVERGERNIALRNIEKIARALGVSLEELFKL